MSGWDRRPEFFFRDAAILFAATHVIGEGSFCFFRRRINEHDLCEKRATIGVDDAVQCYHRASNAYTTRVRRTNG